MSSVPYETDCVGWHAPNGATAHVIEMHDIWNALPQLTLSGFTGDCAGLNGTWTLWFRFANRPPGVTDDPLDPTPYQCPYSLEYYGVYNEVITDDGVGNVTTVCRTFTVNLINALLYPAGISVLGIFCTFAATVSNHVNGIEMSAFTTTGSWRTTGFQYGTGAGNECANAWAASVGLTPPYVTAKGSVHAP